MSKKSTNVLIVGHGEIGTALGVLLERKGNIAVSYFDKDPAKSTTREPLENICASLDIVFFCIPSWTLRETFVEFAPCMKRGIPFVTLSKGLEEKTAKTTAELLDEILPRGERWGVLGGPMLAEELVKGMRGTGVLGTKERALFLDVKQLFKGTNLSLEYSSDAQGVALGGALKNVYAIALGIISALKLGDDARGTLVSHAIEEMVALGTRLGGATETLLGPAGVGDLIATGFSIYSRHHEVGETIVKGGVCDRKNEGCNSLFALLAFLKEKKVNVPPLLAKLEAAVLQPKEARKIFAT